MSEVPEVPESAVAQPEPEPDAVIVFKRTDENGNINTAVQTLGSVQVTEVQTLLELGLRAFREQIGFKP